jgi:glycosyltransferase involved in cell wall biosynthesis
MKILLISNYILDKQESMLRFTDILQKEFKKKGHRVRVIRPKPVFGKFFKENWRGAEKWFAYIDKFLIFPAEIKKAKKWADVVHIIDHGNSYYVRSLRHVPCVVTCCDLLAVRSALGEFRQNPVKWTGRIFQKIILSSIIKADFIACISKNTKQDLLRLSKVYPQNADVVYMGQNYGYKPMEKKKSLEYLKKLSINSKYFFHISNSNWYKNRIGLLKIFNDLAKKKKNINLVMAGFSLGNDLQQYIKQNNLDRKIIFLGNVSNEELRALYSSAVALIYPSLQEGFGWPVAEAQACGCPVFTSNRAPMTEVGGDAAVYFDPENPRRAAEIIARNMNNRKKMKQLGLKNAKRFSTDKMVRKYIEIYKEIKNENP